MVRYRHYLTFTILSTIVFLSNPLIASAEQYQCVSEHATGFSYDKVSKSWTTAKFKTGENYIITESDDEGSSFNVTKVGEKHVMFTCDNRFNKLGYLFCEGAAGKFKFNKNNGRYILSHLAGYFDVLPKINEITDEKSDTPFIEIGHCSTF